MYQQEEHIQPNQCVHSSMVAYEHITGKHVKSSVTCGDDQGMWDVGTEFLRVWRLLSGGGLEECGSHAVHPACIYMV